MRQESRSSLTLGEVACMALFPLLAVVDAVALAAARCFHQRPPPMLSFVGAHARQRARTSGRLTFGELADLAHESRCCKYG
jgi:serine/threonine-protein phosphatase 2B regulatory subunit